jgi:hypothetical protein
MITVRSQRIARSIEHSSPRDVARLVEALAGNGSEGMKYQIHQRLLAYAREHYDKPKLKQKETTP